MSKKGVCKICGGATRLEKVATCSKECRAKIPEWRRQQPEWATRDTVKRVNCEQCGLQFEVSKKKLDCRFCSRNCFSEWKSVTYSGRKLTPEWLKNQSNAKRRENVVKYGDYECEVCNKKFETNLSLRSHRSYCTSSTTEQQNVRCEICNRTFKRQRNYECHIKLKHDSDRNELHRKTVSIACQGREFQKTSKQEIKFYERLKEIFGEENVTHKFHVEGVNHEYDFYVPHLNLIIEYDGDYWHGNKARHELNNDMKRQYKLDISFSKAAISAGYELHRVWASESSQYPEKVRELNV
jgi:very-short-patch-repair endonuclease